MRFLKSKAALRRPDRNGPGTSASRPKHLAIPAEVACQVRRNLDYARSPEWIASTRTATSPRDRMESSRRPQGRQVWSLSLRPVGLSAQCARERGRARCRTIALRSQKVGRVPKSKRPGS